MHNVTQSFYSGVVTDRKTEQLAVWSKRIHISTCILFGVVQRGGDRVGHRDNTSYCFCYSSCIRTDDYLRSRKLFVHKRTLVSRKQHNIVLTKHYTKL